MEPAETKKVIISTVRSDYSFNMTEKEFAATLKSWRNGLEIIVETPSRTIRFSASHIVVIELIKERDDD